MAWTRDEMAQRAARELTDGAYVNLGIGQPMTISNHLPPDKEIILQSENGVLGMGPIATGDDIDPELVNAGKQHIPLLKGGAIFHHGDSFGLRVKRVDECKDDPAEARSLATVKIRTESVA